MLKQTKRRLNRILPLLSWGLVSFAAVGFSTITFYDNTALRSARQKRNELDGTLITANRQANEMMQRLNEAIRCEDQIQVLKAIKADPKQIQMRKERQVDSFKHAISYAHSVGRERSDNEQNGWDKLHIFEELGAYFKKETEDASNRTKDLIKQRKELVESIEQKEKKKSSFFAFFLLANSAGFLLQGVKLYVNEEKPK